MNTINKLSFYSARCYEKNMFINCTNEEMCIPCTSTVPLAYISTVLILSNYLE